MLILYLHSLEGIWRRRKLVLLMAHELIVIVEFRGRILILILLWVKIVNVYHFNESHGNPRLRSVSHHGQHKSNKGRKRNDNNQFFRCTNTGASGAAVAAVAAIAAVADSAGIAR